MHCDTIIMNSVPQEQPSLDFRPSFLPKTVTDFLCHLSSTPNASLNMSLLQDFLSRLELELLKIQPFKRELPLCMFLLNDGSFSLQIQITFLTSNQCWFGLFGKDKTRMNVTFSSVFDDGLC